MKLAYPVNQLIFRSEKLKGRMEKKNILHFGLNRSGTNYLMELVLKQFYVEFVNQEGERNHPLHKHFRIYENKKLIGRPNFINDQYFATFKDFEENALQNLQVEAILLVSKDPYSWHLSYDNWGKKNNWEPSPHPYILEYNEFYKKWIEFAKETPSIMFIRYIDLLINPENIMTQIGHRFNLPMTDNTQPVSRIKKVPMSHRFTTKRLKYYVENQYLNDFSKSELEILNTHIDHKLIREMGYKSYF